MEQIHENVNVHAASMAQPTSQQPDLCEPCNIFEYSSVVEIDMNQAHVNTMETENYTQCIIPLVRFFLNVNPCVKFLCLHTPLENLYIKIIFCLQEQAQVLCPAGDTESGKGLSINTSYHLEFLFDESTVEENNNIVSEKTEVHNTESGNGLSINTPYHLEFLFNESTIEENNNIECEKTEVHNLDCCILVKYAVL